MMRRAIVITTIGDIGDVTDLTMPKARDYANKCNATLIVIDKLKPEYQHPKYGMFAARDVDADRILIADADIVFRADAPDIFEVFPEGNYMLDEASVRRPGVFNAHREEVNAHAVEHGLDYCSKLDETKQWWNPGVTLLDYDAVQAIYQMPPWDVKDALYTTACGKKIVKNMPWINYMIATTGVDMLELPSEWNCFINRDNDGRNAHAWHCAGDETCSTPATKASLVMNVCRQHGEPIGRHAAEKRRKINTTEYRLARSQVKPSRKTGMISVHAVMGLEQNIWILGHMWRAITAHAPDWAICTQGPKSVDQPGVVNFYNPYRGYRTKSRHAADVVFCTHPEVMPLYVEAAIQADSVVVMCRQYQQMLAAHGVPGDKITLVTPGIDDVYRHHKPRLFCPVLMTGRERKGAPLWNALCDSGRYTCVCSNGNLTPHEMMVEYERADAVICTSGRDGEAGPMMLWEALAMGKPMVAPADIGAVPDCAYYGLMHTYQCRTLEDLERAINRALTSRGGIIRARSWADYARDMWTVFESVNRDKGLCDGNN
jgi:glycosyltransferase involved in cell wall biosynthesis